MARADRQAARLVSGGAASLAASVLVDSAFEHYRGSFENRSMVLPLASSALLLAADMPAALRGRPGTPGALSLAVHAAGVAIGTAGLGFHVYNILRHAGGFRLTNLFYQAPIGAPGALVLSGVLGAAGRRLANGGRGAGPLRLGSGKALAGVTAFGLLGTASEAALLHFRGAYHNPAMWLPVTIPPLSAVALARTALTGLGLRTATGLLAATAALGLVGSAFHAWGVSRNMGGWRNWRQNLLAGPPLPAPPAFTGLAVAGLGALLLLAKRSGADA